jgi:hypothetical protein
VLRRLSRSAKEIPESIEKAELLVGVLLEDTFDWPIDMRPIANMLKVCWCVHLHRVREGGDETSEGLLGGAKTPTNEKALWEDCLEKQSIEKLCSGEPLCGLENPICPEVERRQKELYGEICRLVKWPLLLEEERYDYLDERGKEAGWLGEKYEQVASVSKTWPFFDVSRAEERTDDGGTRERFFVSFR